MEQNNVFIENVYMETQTVFHEDGNINIYPCSFELGQHICSGWNMASQKGRMVTEDNGTSHFRPYRNASGPRYQTLMATSHGVLRRCRGQIVIRLAIPLNLRPTQMAKVLMAEAMEIATWLKANSNSLRKRKK